MDFFGMLYSRFTEMPRFCNDASYRIWGLFHVHNFLLITSGLIACSFGATAVREIFSDGPDSNLWPYLLVTAICYLVLSIGNLIEKRLLYVPAMLWTIGWVAYEFYTWIKIANTMGLYLIKKESEEFGPISQVPIDQRFQLVGCAIISLLCLAGWACVYIYFTKVVLGYAYLAEKANKRTTIHSV